MISNQILQSTIDGLKVISRIDLSVMDTGRKCTGSDLSGSRRTSCFRAALLWIRRRTARWCRATSFSRSLMKASWNTSWWPREAAMMFTWSERWLAFQIQTLLVAYKERFDKDNFIKNLLLDNLLLVDIYNRAKKLHIDTEARRVVFLLETDHEKDNSSLESVRTVFGSKNGDFITAVDEKSIIVVKEVGEQEDYSGYGAHCPVRFWSLLEHGQDENTPMWLTERSWRRSKRCPVPIRKRGWLWMWERSSSARENVIAYSSLGIGRLIYQLPIPLCKMFIREIFDGKSPDDFDEETLTTINKFFENSLNVSETSRQLYIHRNTLVYRLDKLQKSTGLDLRVFEDAITFKIALMVVKYMKYMENLEY